MNRQQAPGNDLDKIRNALLYSGYSPIPLLGKRPVIEGWQGKLETNRGEIALWREMYPQAINTGILCRTTPAIDIDVLNPEAADAVEQLAREHFEEHGNVLVRFGRVPRRAVLLRSDEPFKKLVLPLIAPNGGSTDQKIEILGDGQQLVVAGIHPDTGQPYSWFGGEPWRIARESLPYVREADMRGFLDEAAKVLIEHGYTLPSGSKQQADDGADERRDPADWAALIERIRTGQNLHDTIRDLAASFVANGMSEKAAIDKLQGLMTASTVEKDARWRERYAEIPRAVRSARKKFKDDTGTGNKDKPAGLEDAVALRFAELHAADFRYVALWGRWMKYDGAVWRPENTLRTFDIARKLCREAREAKAKTVAAVVTLARADRAVAATINQWDTDANLFNAVSATIDLRTGIARPPDRLDYITKTAAVAPAPPGTPHPLWTAFLKCVMADNAEMIGFLQRYVGYCLTGCTHEHVLMFLFGTGANGKGVFVNTISKLLGDYAIVSPMEMFLTSKHDRHPTEIAKLQGARLVTAQESEKGRRWDEAKIKNLTSDDQLSGRFMRQDFFDFTPTHKLIIAANHKPSLSSVGEAISRRLLLVPFAVQIPKRERDKHLARKLEAEWPAILRWAINGCLEWKRNGLMVPATVLRATEDYLADQDAIGQWLDECAMRDARAFITTSKLFESWKSWCAQSNQFIGSKKEFSAALADRGFEHVRKDYGRGFKGLMLKPKDDSLL
jgi:putative DNA primase/helicase